MDTSHLDTSIRVLVADDEKVARTMVSEKLRILGFNNIVEVADGAEALESLEKAYGTDQEFSLLFSDWQMPNMDGIELFEKLRARPKFSNLTIIFVTSLNEKTSIIKAIELGVDSYIIKPAEVETLLERLNLVAARKAMP